ncbi:hypothetical protein NIES1031_18330 [Chroogloeocystis siderophila 5.2 s.c.1]|uniref:Uncharacterized protein n=2 Tax=Chroogloeocystis TaxID=329162 RepID=A0A1U7HIM0_9CHRO|nr:hypothetical protein NIES1031_18330 [Chroogloeocystis siderophila 5.2 s.c.1]
MILVIIPAPCQLKVRGQIKKLLGCISTEPIKIENSAVKLRGYCLCHHDLYHIEVFYLERIQMGKSKVSGIHGINSPVFHNSTIVPEYDGLLDEARVAFHEWLTRTSAFNTCKAIYWILWLMTRGINPLAVLIRHVRVLQKSEIIFNRKTMLQLDAIAKPLNTNI